MNTTATESLPATHRGRRQFNLRTLFEFTTGVCLLAPAFQDAAPPTFSPALVAQGLVVAVVAVSQFVVCWRLLSRSPPGATGSFSNISFCISALDGFLIANSLQSSRLFLDQKVSLGHFALACLTAFMASMAATCIMALVLLIPALFAALFVYTRSSPFKPAIAGFVMGGLTGLFALAFAWILTHGSLSLQLKPTLLFLLWSVYGGYLGGRLFESRQASHNGVMQNEVRSL